MISRASRSTGKVGGAANTLQTHDDVPGKPLDG
jgi:hypothetical protein